MNFKGGERTQGSKELNEDRDGMVGQKRGFKEEERTLRTFPKSHGNILLQTLPKTYIHTYKCS